MWTKIEDGKEKPKEGQLILLWWDKPQPEIGCFTYAGRNQDGDWKCTFLWGSLRFGCSSTGLATHWMPFEFPKILITGEE